MHMKAVISYFSLLVWFIYSIIATITHHNFNFDTVVSETEPSSVTELFELIDKLNLPSLVLGASAFPILLLDFCIDALGYPKPKFLLLVAATSLILLSIRPYGLVIGGL